jgi:hypothetical protein
MPSNQLATWTTGRLPQECRNIGTLMKPTGPRCTTGPLARSAHAPGNGAALTLKCLSGEGLDALHWIRAM